MKLKFFVLGNCQVTPLIKILMSSHNFSEKFELIASDRNIYTIHLLNEKTQERLFEILANVDLFIYQNNGVSYGEKLSTDFLVKNFLKPTCLTISFPNSYYKGYNPETIYLKNNGVKLNSFCDYHDLNIIRDYLLKKDISSTISNISNIDYYSNDFIWENAKNSLNELRKREINTDITISDFIEENWTKVKLFHSMNHPSNLVLLEIADRILNRLGLPKLTLSEKASQSNEYLNNTELPIYKSLAKILSFKLPEDCRINNKYLSIKDYVNSLYKIYDEIEIDILQYNLNIHKLSSDKGLLHIANYEITQNNSTISTINITMLEHNPGISNLWNLANTLQKEGKINEAIIHYQQIIELEPENAIAHRLLALAQQKVGFLEEAIINYKKAIVLSSNTEFWNYMDIVSIFGQQKKWDDAITAYQEFIKKYPDNCLGYHYLGVSQKNCGDFHSAVDSYQKSNEIKKLVLNYRDLGAIFMCLKDWDKAINAYQEAIKLQSNPAFYQNLAIAQKANGDLDGSILTCHKAIELGLEGDFLLKIAEIYSHQQEWNNLLTIYIKSINSNPKLVKVNDSFISQITQAINKNLLTESDILLSFKECNWIVDNQLSFTVIKIIIISKYLSPKNFILFMTLLLLSGKKLQSEFISEIDSLKTIISLHPEISWDKKFTFLHVLSLIVNSEEILKNWLSDFCKNSSLEQDIILFSHICPHKHWISFARTKSMIDGLSFDQRLSLIQPIRDSINSKIKLLANQYLPKFTTEKKEIKNFLFVVTLVQAIPTLSHLKTIIDYAYFLSKYVSDSKITILMTNELSAPNDICIQPMYPCVKNLNQHYEICQKYYPDFFEQNIEFVLGKQLSLEDDIKYADDLLQKIGLVNPDVVLFFGGVLGSWILPEVLYERYPTMYKQFNLGNQPISNFDIYIAAGNHDNFDQFIHPERWRKQKHLFMPFPKEKVYDYSRVKAKKEDLAIITVGTNLQNRIADNEYLDKMAEILQKFDSLYWVLIGVSDVEKFLVKSNLLENQYKQGKVKLITFESDLRALYEICDICIYPKHGGGAGGMSLAVSEGLPIVCYKGNDIECYFLGNDVDFFETDTEYFNYLIKLIEEPSFRKSEGQKLKKYLSEDYPESCMSDFLNLCIEAQQSMYFRNKIL